MNIEALVFDLDGTAISNARDGMPTQAVIDAVAQAQQQCHVSVATGRPYAICKDILSALNISELCILNGGTHLYNPQTNNYEWKKEIPVQTMQHLLHKLAAFESNPVADEVQLTRAALSKYTATQPVGLFCMFELSPDSAQQVHSIVSQIPELCSHSVGSWKPNTFDVHITHELGTKKHALESLMAHLNVDHENVLVVGDGGNDIPLFELAGHRVAMGNAAPELKALAGWVAPDVSADGLAVTIHKYILNN